MNNLNDIKAYYNKKPVEYIVKDWDKENINFEKVNKDNDKMFPEILVFDKRYPDAENEVFAERVSKAKKKPEVLDSFGIFIDKNLINQHNINDDATISGIALLNFNQKKRTWGWKATKITQVFNIDDLNYD